MGLVVVVLLAVASLCTTVVTHPGVGHAALAIALTGRSWGRLLTVGVEAILWTTTAVVRVALRTGAGVVAWRGM